MSAVDHIVRIEFVKHAPKKFSEGVMPKSTHGDDRSK